ncbi:MAG: GNAT family N-acetyltransferase [Phycisphaerales bacterium]|nr:GNAT family N-acetyltransferase [Planctomycetota bacterium]MCH8507511.1 GNAT family N-acetyltransferase [Phycisphaerales bacterium]
MPTTQPAPNWPGPDEKPSGKTRNPERVPPELRLAAAERLVSAPDRAKAARSLIETADDHGIDLDLLWGSIDRSGRHPRVTQACLAVPTAGRTVMLFLSAPGPDRQFGAPSQQIDDLTGVLQATLTDLPVRAPQHWGLAQVLVEPGQTWAESACRNAGMMWVGRLHFMRLAWPARMPASTPWPPGVTVEAVADPLDFSPQGDGTALEWALDRTYEATLDCPELCGLRSTRDVIASHMATGSFDPAHWWVVRLNGEPEGCCLLNHCPATRSIELVYIGISPRLRGHGLARRVLEYALTKLNAPGAREVTCAVDTRNTPALKLYHAMGFRAFGSRTGFVKPLPGSQIEAKPHESSTSPTGGGSIGTSGGQENIVIPKHL